MRNHIIIHVEGGLVRDVISADSLDYTVIPQGGGRTEKAYFSACMAEVNPKRVEAILKATERHEKTNPHA